jgi:hypothetical protein
MQITLDLTAAEVNQILGSLSKQPYAEVAVLIAKIKQQGDPQVEEQAKLVQDSKE